MLGGILDFREMLQRTGPPQADEEAWDPAAPTRFASLASRLWTGLLDHEVLTDR